MDGSEKYVRMEDIPNEYMQYLIDVDEINWLQGYDLEYIKVHSTESYYGVKRCFEDDLEEKRIYIGVFVYSDKIRLTSEAFLSTDELLSVDGEEEGLLIRENPNGEVECTIYFYEDNAQYYVEGNVERSILIEIANRYKEMLSE